MKHFSIRLLDPRDLPRLCTIENATQINPWSEQTFLQCFKSDCLFFGVDHHGALAGFLTASFHPMGEGHILNLGVDPLYQRQGIATALIQHAFDKARAMKIGIVYLEVRRSNQHAIALYQKLGFVEVLERKNYYSSPKGREDAIVYAIDLHIDMQE